MFLLVYKASVDVALFSRSPYPLPAPPPMAENTTLPLEIAALTDIWVTRYAEREPILINL